MKMEQAECSETSTLKFQTSGIQSKQRTQNSEHGKILKLGIRLLNDFENGHSLMTNNFMVKCISIPPIRRIFV
jgi:hypothetical protein